MRRYNYNAYIQKPFGDNKIIGNGIQHPIEQQICPAAHRITERLSGDKNLQKRKIEPINHPNLGTLLFLYLKFFPREVILGH